MFQPNAVYHYEGFVKSQKIIQSSTAAAQVNVIGFHRFGLFKSFADEICSNGKIRITATLEYDDHVIFRANGVTDPERLIITRFIPKWYLIQLVDKCF